MSQFRKFLITLFNSYSEILFLRKPLVGFILFAASFVDPNIGIAGLIAVISAYIFARFINAHETFLSSGFYTYNPLLVGFSIGYLFKLHPLTFFFIVFSSILTFVITVILADIFYRYFRLPVLSIPFVIVSSIIYLATYSFSNLFVNYLYPRGFHFQTGIAWLDGFLQSLGAIFFFPHVFFGFMILLAVLITSRILTFVIVLGYFVGVFIVYLLTGSSQFAFADINAFNYILTAIAVGSIFLVPSPFSYGLSVVAVALSVIVVFAVNNFWSLFGVPVFTLPFNMVSLSFIYVLGLFRYRYIAWYIGRTPEETLDNFLSYTRRFRGYQWSIGLPFSGEWTVWQGFDGKWTHKGAWKYAYDFVITDEEGKTYRGDGYNLEDYYCYRKPVLSPVRGRVVRVVNHLPDNPIGKVDMKNNWGNLVIIYDERGFYVEISHFAQNSIRVKEGDWVEKGAMLGLCGNSGYSPQPHIHIQVQLTDRIGAPSVPFSFSSYISGGRFFYNDNPSEGEKVKPVFPDRGLFNLFSFPLESTFTYEMETRKGKKFRRKYRVATDSAGYHYIGNENARLYFYKTDEIFYFYRLEGKDPILQLLFRALPRIPFTYEDNLEWKDSLPMKITMPSWQYGALIFLSSFKHDLVDMDYTGRFTSRNTIRSTVDIWGKKESFTVKLADDWGVESVEGRDVNIKLVEVEL